MSPPVDIPVGVAAGMANIGVCGVSTTEPESTTYQSCLGQNFRSNNMLKAYFEFADRQTRATNINSMSSNSSNNSNGRKISDVTGNVSTGVASKSKAANSPHSLTDADFKTFIAGDKSAPGACNLNASYGFGTHLADRSRKSVGVSPADKVALISASYDAYYKECRRKARVEVKQEKGYFPRNHQSNESLLNLLGRPLSPAGTPAGRGAEIDN
jgi:hypothetical protein